MTLNSSIVGHDVTLRDHLRQSPEQAIETILDIIRKVRSVGGEFIPVCIMKVFRNRVDGKDGEGYMRQCYSRPCHNR